tara:strand:- start:144 stop:605 length:462 start_codon:yes stop_codon:yes gene_type:complete
MKKLLGIVLLLLILCNISFAGQELRGIKSFKLDVVQEGDCQGKKYINDVKTSIEYVIANSKIKLVDNADKYEFLKAYMLTIGNDTICSSMLELYSYNYGTAKNSAGNLGFYRLDSFIREGVYFASPANHKSQVLDWFESRAKKLVVEWTNAQK